MTLPIDTAVLGMVGAATMAVIGAAAKAFQVASTIGGMLERNKEAEKNIALIPSMAHQVGVIDANLGALASRHGDLAREVRKQNSEMHELKTQLEVEKAVRHHSQGDYHR